jgi:hypothetical protein
LLMTAAIVAIALTTPIGRGTAEAHNVFHGEREFRGGGFRFGGLFGGYYPGYPRYGTC